MGESKKGSCVKAKQHNLPGEKFSRGEKKWVIQEKRSSAFDSNWTRDR